MNHGGTARTPFGRVKLTAAIHSSSMPDGSTCGNPAASSSRRATEISITRGHALTSDMKLIASRPSCVRSAPIGDFFTMGIDDALRARTLLEQRKSSASLRHLPADQARSRRRDKGRTSRRNGIVVAENRGTIDIYLPETAALPSTWRSTAQFPSLLRSR